MKISIFQFCILTVECDTYADTDVYACTQTFAKRGWFFGLAAVWLHEGRGCLHPLSGVDFRQGAIRLKAHLFPSG